MQETAKMKMYKTFRFRAEPSAAQENVMARIAGARRYVWNWALNQRMAHYYATGHQLSPQELSRQLTQLKRSPETLWLCEVNAQAMQQVLMDLNAAFKAFFNKQTGFPKFKSKKSDRARFRLPQCVKVLNGIVSAPSIGKMPIRQSQSIDGKTKSATFKRDAVGNWDMTLVTEFEMPDTALPPVDPLRTVGIDLGLLNYIVSSDGDAVAAPRFYRTSQRALARGKRRCDRRHYGSKRREKARRALAIVHRKVANQRKDFIHKLSTSLVNRYEGICIEDLNVVALAKTKLRGHSKSILDASFGEFKRQLQYKSVWNRRHFVMVSQRYPSSKTCSICGAVNASLPMEARSWTCVCGVCHDRDLNAAVNIRIEGLRLIAAGHAEILNARGPHVRLPHLGAVGVEA